MIVDTLENAGSYYHLGGRVEQALKLLADPAVQNAEPGRYEVDGTKLYYIVMDYQTGPVEEGLFEVHEKYIDIQFVAKGAELIGYAPLDGLAVAQPYDSDKDAAMYALPEDFSRCMMQAGMFAVFYPQDAHLPSRHLAEPSAVRKIVIKVAVD